MGVKLIGLFGGQGAELLADLQEVITIPLESLKSGPGREVASPVGMRIGSIGEEVVALGGPSDSCIVQGLQVARGCRVQEVYV